jgi:hypothetical protein
MDKRPLQVTLADGSTGYVQPNGHVIYGVSGVIYEEPDGNGGTITIDTTNDPGRHERRRAVVQTFKKSRQYRQAIRKLRAPARARAGTGRARQRGAGRPKAQAARSSAASGDSGSDSDPPPPTVEPWRWASEASWRSFVASIERRDFEREVALERWRGVRS